MCPSCGLGVGSVPPAPPPGFVSTTTTGFASPTSAYSAWRPVPMSAFGLPLANWGGRLGARLMDSAILWSVLWFVFSCLIVFEVTGPILFQCNGVGHEFQFKARQVTTVYCGSPDGHLGWVWALDVILFLLIDGAYFALLNGLGNGQTLGNIAAGIAVRNTTTGAPIGPGRGILRWLVQILLYTFFIIPGLLNDLWPLWDQQGQTLADKACNSVMIRVR